MRLIKLIRASKTPEDAKNGLMSNFALSEIQSKAILRFTPTKTYRT